MKNHNVTTARMLALLACAMLLLGVVVGCTASNGGASTLPADQKAMTEAIAKWYVAQGSLDVTGFKAGIFDPEDTLGVASMTSAPPDAKKSDVNWAWVGDKIVVNIGAGESTAAVESSVTLSPSKTATNVVDVADSSGSSGTFVMINKDGVWKIDVAATQKAAAAAEASASVPATGTP